MWRLVGFYGHHETHLRKYSWALMKFVGARSELLTVYMAIFNESFVTPSWHELFKDSEVKHLSTNRSDHMPVLLVWKTRRGGAMRHRFRFKACWTQFEGCKEAVVASWNEAVGADKQQKVLNGGNISSKSIPSFFSYPFTTSRALYLGPRLSFFLL
ncbi:hypothetical protein LIER_30942 [Lithospermum erythrorhizon]|uniref:Uncharacterized protein n=1 Tax=Lithospermum erythrorhizon TaxID=34254 RepID=A0AAV3RT25_LITER